jgi:2-oxoglutarate dehydrogenase E2 component (dihydrolipoamide succinyltransferase)
MRIRIADRLKEAQNTNAMLTTFNEIDMSSYINMRKDFGEAFLKKHDIKLGFMSGFVRAATLALKEQPVVNAVIDGKDMVYRDFVDISVAVATPKGLVVPVLRNCQNMEMHDVEIEMAALGAKAKKNAITLEDMTGGTFTITNGGVFGSMMGTPIINPPQSAILGMHATKMRPVVVGS